MPRLARVVIAIFVWDSLIAQAAVFAAAEGAPGTAASAQVWEINTRSAGGCGNLEAELPRITYARLDESGGCAQWRASDAGTFQATAERGAPTIVLIHGNGTDEDWAVRHGNEFYCLAKRQACGRPFRLVVWSWPADRVVRRVRPDVQMKVCRSDVESYYLAQVLANLPQATPLSLVGYSLGCRTASGALQLLAGGSVAGRSLTAEVVSAWSSAGRRPIRVMMVAAAMDANWLEPNCPHGRAPAEVQRILVVKNGCDRVLKYYSRLYGRNGPEALGYAGPTSTAGGKLEVVDVSGEVGHMHDFSRYEESWSVDRRLGWYTFLCDAPATVGKPTEKSALAAKSDVVGGTDAEAQAKKSRAN
jgi:pimeloyl-ACP methyl ester carboxylesterase